ncbi:MAG: O-antigen ligase family protein [Candidatus Woesearchaeota archaeon]
MLIIFIPLIIFSFIIQPFDASKLYQFSFNRWSHVVFSRFIALTILFIIIYNYNKFKHLLLLILFLGLLYSGARGPLVFIVFFIIYKLLHDFKNIPAYLVLIFLVSFILFTIFLIDDSNQRIFQIFNYNELINSSPTLSRIEAIKKSINVIFNNFWFGIGIGGFNSDLLDGIGKDLKYPHNIFIEVFCEIGFVGILILIIILFSNFMFLIKRNEKLVYLFLFALFLSLFSKDLSTNPLLFSLVLFHFHIDS